MGGYSWSGELRKNDGSMSNNPGEPTGMNAIYQFFSAEGTLPRSTPDVYAVSVKNQNPDISAEKRLSQPIEAHLIVGRYHHGRFIIGIAESVKAGIDTIAHPPNTPANLDNPQVVRPTQNCGNPRQLTCRGPSRTAHKGLTLSGKTRLSLCL